MKVLETERLILRRLTLADAAFLLELMNEPGFIQYVADRGLRTVADAEGYLEEKILPSYERFGFGFYRVELRESGEPIGICGLIKRETLAHPDVGFALLARFCGRGYAHECAVAVLEQARDEFGLSVVAGVTAPDNHVSIGLLQKLGLKYRGRIDLPGFSGESLLFE